MKEKEKSEQKNKSANFLVKIQYCEHHSWQGTIKWMETNEEQPFRSALELIKLMDSAAECLKK